MSANDVRGIYEKAFATIRQIVETFPESKWLVPHGDDYYIPCRIAYHLAVFIDRTVAGGFKDPDFAAKLPYGPWMEATAETLPDKATYLVYYDAVIARAKAALDAMVDEDINAPIEPERAWIGSSQLAVLLYNIREISAHTGEMNKMLIENGLPDIWVYR